MALLQKINKKLLQIGNNSLGLVFPKSFIFPILWFKKGKDISIELHSNEDGEFYIIIKRVKND